MEEVSWMLLLQLLILSFWIMLGISLTIDSFCEFKYGPKIKASKEIDL